jgi:hypothetical protein
MNTPIPVPTESPTTPEPSNLDCPTYQIRAEISIEEYEWSVWVLENIEPGVTQFDEVTQLLGQPTEVDYNSWRYDPGLGGVGLYVYRHDEDRIVDKIGIWRPMTLGQLVETYGEPSRVYRSTDIAIDAPPPGLLPLTFLFYDEHHLLAMIQQGLCSFPRQLPIDLIEVTSESLDDIPILSSNAVEIEWPGLTN